MSLRAPFPWFGGKSRVAHLVWERFGQVHNYVETFAGSLAVLLARPHEPRIETVNDIDCYLANWWRAVSRDPEAVAAHADWPVNEADLHARHLWLVGQDAFRERMKTDPEFYDARIAGWWVWGVSMWIGSGWCSRPDWQGRVGGYNTSRGMHAEYRNQDRADGTPRRGRPCLKGAQGVEAVIQKRPQLGGHGPGRGVHRKLPVSTRGNDKGVHSVARPSRQLPNISGSQGAAGRGLHASAKGESLMEWFGELATRLRSVRVCCGDWTRVLGPSATIHIGTTAVFLDPPYDPEQIAVGAGQDGFAKADRLYAEHDAATSAAVRQWAIEHGDDPRLRIALCGYEGEHDMPASWDVLAWKAAGGYSNRGEGASRNRTRERVWFSPHCLGGRQRGLFVGEEVGDAV